MAGKSFRACNGPQVAAVPRRKRRTRSVVERMPLRRAVCRRPDAMNGGVVAGGRCRCARLPRGHPARRGDGRDADAGRPLRPLAQPANKANRPFPHRRRGRAVCVMRDGRWGATAPGAWRRMATSPTPAWCRRATGRGAGGAGKVAVLGPPLAAAGRPSTTRLLDSRASTPWSTKTASRRCSPRQLEAEVLMILTNVDAVYEGWGTPAARPIRRMTVSQADADDRGRRVRRRRDAAQGRSRGGIRPRRRRSGDHRPYGLRTGRALEGETGTTIVRDA